MASLITGLYPSQHKVLGNDWVYNRVLDKKIGRIDRTKQYRQVIEHFETLTTLPEMIKEKGYLSFQTGKWWQGNYAVGGFDLGMTHGDPTRDGRHGDFGLEIGRKGMDTLYQRT